VAALLVGTACTSAEPATRAPSRPVSTTAPPLSYRVPRNIKDVAGQPIPFGSARYFGGIPPSDLGSGVTGIAASPNGRGYWLATANGKVFRYGHARRYSSQASPGEHIAAIVASGGEGGYWLASSSGAVFSFGGAASHGSAGSLPPGTPVVAMAAAPGGRGYWLAASDGSVLPFGDARFYGSASGDLVNDHLVAMAATPDGRGYWLAASDGRVFHFGDARFYGSASSAVRKNPIVAMAAAPDGRGYWLVPTSPPPPVGLPAPAEGFIAGHVTAIGDSVMLDAAPDLEADIPGIDVEAAVSRQWYEGMSLAEQLKAEGRLGAIVVVDLGTNGPVSPGMFTAMMNILAGASRVVFVTVHLPPDYSWSHSVNATLQECVPRYSRDRLADFNKLADENPQWFYSDGVHMPIGGTGARAMALLIKSEI
jgi:ligand-binding sensor domain-containing protein